MNESTPALLAYIAVGSNIRPEENVPDAMEMLANKIELISISTFYECKALGRPNQPDYRNGVVALRTHLPPGQLIEEVLRPIEAELNRKRSQDKYAARTIDLDLILYGDQVFQTNGMNLPDPNIRERSFVAVPLLELDPDLVMPDDGVRLSELPVAAATDELRIDENLTQALKEKVCYE